MWNRYTIIDEADEMVSDDWTEEMKRILSGGGKMIGVLSNRASTDRQQIIMRMRIMSI